MDKGRPPYEEDINGFIVRWRAQSTKAQQQVVRDILENMVLVEGGTFTMGATPEQYPFARVNEYPTLTVKQSSFYICKYEVSNQQFIDLIPWVDKNSDNLRISWEDWLIFMDVLNDISSIRFSLPTESQWEYAARGGKNSQGFIYPGSNNLDDVWTDSPTEGSKVPNELGLFNMADLKSEWCLDFYENYNSEQMLFDRYIQTGKINNTGEQHVVRGGNYLCSGKSKKYMESKSGLYDRFGYYNTSGSNVILKALDYRYCRISARSYYTTFENGTKDIGARLVININQ